MRKRRYNEHMPTMTAQTLPRRLLRPEDPSPFRITERDIEIIRAINRFGYLTSEQIVRFLTIVSGPTSQQNVARRLSHLYEMHYLNRPAHQVVELLKSSHYVYGLGREGAHLLARLGDSADPRLQWASKNSRVSATHLIHTFETADVMFEFERACRSMTDFHLLDHAALLPYLPEATRALAHPFRLRVTLQQEGKPFGINVVPDRVCSIMLSPGQRYNFFIERDRGTMSVAARRITGKSSYARKILAYYVFWQQNRHRELGFQGFRVLSVTSSDTRITNMIKVQREITHDRVSALFLYTTLQRLSEHGAFGKVWRSSESDGVSLLDRK